MSQGEINLNPEFPPVGKSGDSVQGEAVGNLTSVKVLERKGDGQARVRIGGGEETVARMPAEVPEGGIVAARIEGPRSLEIMSAAELRNTETSRIDNFLTGKLNISGKNLNRKRRQLLNQGYVTRDSGSGAKVPVGEGGQLVSSALSSEVNQLLELLGAEQSSSNVSRLLDWVRSNPDSGVEELFATFDVDFSEASETTREAAGRLLKFIKLSLDSEPADNSQIFGLLERLGLQADKANLELLRTLKSMDGLPSPELLKELFSSVPLLKDGQGELSASRLKAFLFLKQNDLPANEKILDSLAAFSAKLNSDSASGLPELPQLLPAEGEIAQQLKEVLRRLGFDLESQLNKRPDRAANVFRSALQADLQQSGEEDSGTKKQFYGQLIKHSLASVAEADTLYLFVPFQVGDRTKFIRMRIQDQREQENENREQHWSVTLELELSQLGPLRVSLRRIEEELQVTLEAASRSGLQLLRSNTDELRGMLGELGYQVVINCNRLEEDEQRMIERELLKLDSAELSSLDIWA